MKPSRIAALTLLSASLAGCQGVEPGPSSSGMDVSYAELPQRYTSVSGTVFDPEAFFVAFATWPEVPGHPEYTPPPGLLADIPYIVRAAPVGAHVSLVAEGSVAGTSDPVSPAGSWLVSVPTSDTSIYLARAEPPTTGGVVVGAPDLFPPSEGYAPIASGTYYPTTSLRPILANTSACHVQVAEMLGDAGGLSAVAKKMSSTGPATTPADLVNPAKTAGVVFMWAHSPSAFLDAFEAPGDDGIKAEVSAGRLFALDWAPPGTKPLQSAMGYYVVSTPTISPLGYFALVLPLGTTKPVTVKFTDTMTDTSDPFNVRPWVVPGATVEVRPGISFLRLHAYPGGPPPEENPADERGPQMDLSWICLPEEGPP